MLDEAIQWTFYGYVTPAGGREVLDWFVSLPDVARDEAVDTLVYLQALPLHLWAKPQFFQLGAGLSEVRFKANTLNKIYRIYGCFWPSGGRNYTLLLGADKKVSNPRSTIREARKRMQRLGVTREASVHEFRFSK